MVGAPDLGQTDRHIHLHLQGKGKGRRELILMTAFSISLGSALRCHVHSASCDTDVGLAVATTMQVQWHDFECASGHWTCLCPCLFLSLVFQSSWQFCELPNIPLINCPLAKSGRGASFAYNEDLWLIRAPLPHRWGNWCQKNESA
jgi:hypothetical protein